MILKSILFDLDNTLLDFSGFKRETAQAAAKAMKSVGIETSEKLIYDKIFEVYDEHGIEYQLTFDLVLRELGYPHNYFKFERAKQAAIIAYQKKKYSIIKPQPKAVRILTALKAKYKLGIVTDAPQDKAWQRLVLAGLDGFFDPVITFNDTGVHKPSTTPFRKALAELKVQPKECLFVGDNQERDIAGARRVGIPTCLAKYGCVDYVEEQDLADYKIKSLDGLKAVIAAIESKEEGLDGS